MESLKKGIEEKGSAKRIADIGIQDDKITYIGSIDNLSDCRIIDAADCVVAPGFIDIHSHSDFFCLVSPESESKIHDGVTTEICGNCGISAFPLKGQLLENKVVSHGRVAVVVFPWRSEERRVGKECRSRWSPYH